MKDGIIGEKTLAAFEKHLSRATLEKRFKTLENEKRLAFKDYLVTGNVGWFKQVGKESDMLLNEIFKRGGIVTCKGFATVIDWGDEA